jgi:hypothetical protein
LGLLTWLPAPFPTSLSPTLFPPFSACFYPISEPTDGSGNGLRASCLVLIELEAAGAESTCRVWRSFKLRPFSSCDFNFRRRIYYRFPKIVKIIICTLYLDENVSIILIYAILICGLCYAIISIQSYRIFFYIENTRRFCCFTYLHYKQQSHGKEISVPQYATLALGSQFHLETWVKRTSFKLSFKDS